MTDQKLALLEVKVDTQEPDDTLEKVLLFCPLATRAVLPMGDIVYEHVAIELKSWTDFINAFTSKSDDRFRRQLYNFLINKDIEGYYIIYGRWEEINEYSQVGMTAVLGAIASIQARYGMRLMVLPNKNYAIYVSLKLIEKTFDHKNVRPVVYKVGTDERAIDMLVAAGKSTGSGDAIRLLEHFGNAKAVVNATSNQLQKVKKIGKVKAENLMKTFTYDFKAKKDFDDSMNEDMKLADEEPDTESEAPVVDVIDIESDKVSIVEEGNIHFEKDKEIILTAIKMYNKKKRQSVPLANL
ncbi:hypothetical protein LCGC14_1635800, partial [marine sediment metagenome]